MVRVLAISPQSIMSNDMVTLNYHDIADSIFDGSRARPAIA